MAKRLIGALLAAAFLTALLWFSQQRPVSDVVSGLIEADELRLGSRVGGRVAKVLVKEGQAVQAGDLLVELEPFDLRERRGQAEAALAERRAEFSRIKTGFREEEIAQGRSRLKQLQAYQEKLRSGPRPQEINAAEADVELAHADLKLATLTFNRVETLYGKQAATRDDLDEAATKLSVAQARSRSAAEHLDLLKAGTRTEELAQAEAQVEEATEALKLLERGSRPEDVQRAEASVLAAEAALQAVDQQLAELRIVATSSGTVDAIDLQPGELVPAGAPVLTLIDTSHLWVRAYVPENRLNLMENDAVEVSVDSFAGRKFAARVTFIAREAEFTPRNVQTPEERSKQVFRIKVTLQEGLDVLRPGMNADVWLRMAGSERQP